MDVVVAAFTRLFKHNPMKVRASYMAGKFYASDGNDIIKLLNEALASQKATIRYELSRNRILGGVVPHAGHMFCAREAVHFFEVVKASEEPFETVVIIGPNHTGEGVAMSVDTNEKWQTPLGLAEIDKDLALQLSIPFNDHAQRYEHSVEVIVPYVQHFLGSEVKILPINMLSQNIENSIVLAERVWSASRTLKRRILLIASSDFCHFKSSRVGYELDSYALEPLLEFDLSEFQRRVLERGLSICGFGPIMAMLAYSKMVSSKAKIEVLKRGHSGEVYPAKAVVDYISMLSYV